MDLQGGKKNSEYWQKRLEAKAFYSSFRRIWCPALSDWVVFNNQGFNHLLRKGASLRSEKEQMRRFRLLKLVVSILTSHDTTLVLRRGKGVKFWGLEKSFEQQVVTVVVRQADKGQKHFFSVMNEKSK